MQKEFKNYQKKHKTEFFVMLDETDLNYDQFVELYNKSFAFREMWKIGCDFNYYEIRAGKCQHSKVIKGKIICEIKCS